MPALPDAERAIKIRWTGLVGGVRWANILYAQFTAGTPSTTDLTTLATSIRGILLTRFQGLMHVSCTVDTVELIDVSSRTGAMGAATTSFTGTRAGQPLPNQVACCVSKLIARRYRGGHPRFYFPGAVVTDMNGVLTWASSYSINMKAAADGLLSDINALTSASTGLLKLANVSYWYTPVKNQPPVLRSIPLVEPITGMRVDPRVDTQRRRLD